MHCRLIIYIMKFESVLRYNSGVSWYWNFTENCYNEQDEQKVTVFWILQDPLIPAPSIPCHFAFPNFHVPTAYIRYNICYQVISILFCTIFFVKFDLEKVVDQKYRAYDQNPQQAHARPILGRKPIYYSELMMTFTSNV